MPSSFPATLGPSIAGLVTVGGITRENKLWSGSCHGGAVELFAPAEDVLVAVNTPPGPANGRVVSIPSNPRRRAAAH
jgi:hypothetical protein